MAQPEHLDNFPGRLVQWTLRSVKAAFRTAGSGILAMGGGLVNSSAKMEK